ncbi:MAG: hypothetical protein ACK5M3_16760 [Dysgonomonas sp.]
MEKEKNILHGVTLLFCIDIIVLFISQLIEIAVCKLSPSIYLVLPLNLTLYAAVLYIVFGKIKKFPEISILIFVALFALRSISQNLGMLFFTREDTIQIANIEVLERVFSLLYSFVFAGLAYKCYKKELKKESGDAYIYYGIILFTIIDNASDIVMFLLSMTAQMIYIPYILAGVVAVCCIALFVYIFLEFVKSKPHVHLLVIFIIIIAGYLSPSLFKYGNPYSTYNDITEYGYTSGFLSIISGWTYILLVIISYIKYHKKYHKLRKTGASRLRVQNILMIGLVFLPVIMVGYASNYLRMTKSSDVSFYKMKEEVPTVITSHMPDYSGYRSSVDYPAHTYTSLISYHEGSSAMKTGRELLDKGYIAKYEANDPHLVCLSTFRIEAKLKAKKITYSTLDINGVMYYPVPEFGFGDDPSIQLNLCGLPSDFTIYIIEAKPEKLREKSDLARIMPQGWESGYTKGVCISEQRNTVIYWGAAW